MKKIWIYLAALFLASCNDGESAAQLTKSASTDRAKIPLTIENFYQDNNYENKPTGLIDGDLSTGFLPAWNLINLPHDVVCDISDFKATIKKIRIYDGNGDGFSTKLILVRKDNGKEVAVGTYTGSGWNQWVEFTPPSDFEATQFIMRGVANPGYGNELELIGDFTPYKEPAYSRAKRPLKNMLGVNAHWWNFLDNQKSKESSVVEAKYQAFLDLGITSLRNYGDATHYQPVKGKWSFNPVRQGWYEDELFKRLAHDRPELVKWSVLQGQFDFVRQSWEVPDSSRLFKGTVTSWKNNGTWGVLVIKTTAHKGEGQYDFWHVTLDDKPVPGKSAKDYNLMVKTVLNVPTKHPSELAVVTGSNVLYTPGQKVIVYKGQASELNFYYKDNNKRDSLKTYEVLGNAAYVFASRGGKNPKVADYGVWSHVDYDSQHAQWIAKNEVVKGSGLYNLFEGMNEPNAWWAGINGYMRGSQLAAAWSMMYDGHKGKFPACGVKNADPEFKMSISGLAVATTDLVRAVYAWSQKNRGYKKDGSVDLPFDIIQFHCYASTGGANQFNGATGGLPPELSGSLDAVDEYVHYSNKYAQGKEVWVGEWGYDVHPESPMNAPPYGPYTAEQARGNWAIRTILEFNAHGVDRAQWYRLYQDGDWADKDATQFATMSLLRAHNNGTYTRHIVGDYFKQIGELGDYVFDSRISDKPRVLKFRNGNKVFYAIWAVEKLGTKGKRPDFTETTGSYTLTLPGITSIAVKQLVDGGSAMSTENVAVNGSYKINYSAKPIFVVVTETGSK